MKPDLSNYEIWIADYLDGHLNKHQIQLLEEFLNANPDIKEELKLFQELSVKPFDNSFKNKNLLKKTSADLTDYQFDLLCIGELEGDLSPEEKDELYEIISQNPDRFKTFKLINKIKLLPPKGLKYKYIHKLKKGNKTAKIISLASIATGIAATVVFLIYLSFYPLRKSSNRNVISMVMEMPVISDNKLITVPDTGFDSSAPVSSSSSDAKEVLSLIGNAINENPEGSDKVIDTAQSESIKSANRIERINIHPVNYAAGFPMLFETPSNLYHLVQINPTILIKDEQNEGLKRRFTAFIRERILGIENKTDEELKAYEIAKAGINGLNKLLGWQMVFNGYVDDTGELTAINFSSKLVKFNIPVRKNYADE